MKILLVFLFIAVVFNVFVRMREDRRRQKLDEAMVKQQDAILIESLALHGDIIRMLAMLQVWAEHSPEPMRELLQKAFKQ